jgi:hypothetical protein
MLDPKIIGENYAWVNGFITKLDYSSPTGAEIHFTVTSVEQTDIFFSTPGSGDVQ